MTVRLFFSFLVVLFLAGAASASDAVFLTRPVKIDSSSNTVSVNGSTVGVTNNGTFAVQAAQSGTYTVTPGTGAFSVNGSTLGVVQAISPWGTTQTPATSGGLLVFSTNSITNSTQTVKGSAGQIYGWSLYNSNATIRFLHFYNQTTVTMGTTADTFSIAVPATSLVQGGSVSGIAFGTGIAIAATTASSPTDNGAPSVNDVQAVIFYK